jgi:hypothetical protein
VRGGTPLGNDRTDGGGAEAGQIAAIHDGKRDAGGSVIIDLHAGNIRQILSMVLGKRGHPLETARVQLVQIGRHGVDEVRRIRTGRMHADLGLHLVGSSRVLAQSFFHHRDHDTWRQCELHDVVP